MDLGPPLPGAANRGFGGRKRSRRSGGVPERTFLGLMSRVCDPGLPALLDDPLDPVERLR